jgi:hypothetical protein
MRELPSQVKETLSIKGRGSAGLRRLSRRGSWVRIPPPAPITNPVRLFGASDPSASRPSLAHEDFARVIRISFRDALLSGWDFGLVFSRRVRYRLVGDVVIPAGSPWDKRESVRSGNRMLRIGIGADNGLILVDKPENCGFVGLRRIWDS